MALPRYMRRIILVAVDATAVFCAFGLAYALGVAFENESIERRLAYLRQFLDVVFFLVGARLVLFAAFGLYRRIARYVSLYEIVTLGLATALGTVLLLSYNLLGHPGYEMRIPWRVVILEGMLTFLAIGGLRFARRLLAVAGLMGARTGRRLLIIGIGPSAERICRELMFTVDSDYQPVALIDPNRMHIGGRLHGVPIVGGIDSIRETVRKYAVEEILIAQPRATPELFQRIVAECEKTRVEFKLLPSLADLMEGKVTVSDLRPVEIEDLLGRPPVQLSLGDEQNYLKGECVLVTGAGGSIGAELCRQIRRYGPSRLVLVGRGENSIYEIATELGFRFDSKEIEMFVGDVRAESRMRRIFERCRPTVIYHAAAHKHVPIMELYPDEAVTNNIFGTEVMARLADEFGAKIFIMISTDKAVRPANIMGATKRVGEMVVHRIGSRSRTRFLTVRFGNVLGSRGSVVPLFKRQIEAGGPVTVTHPEATRYCMTIPEAVNLVIQTGALRDRGSLFLLDMGRPIKVIDLARNLITLSGLEPETDIPIQIVGLRPGEKMYEELLTEGEGIQATDVGKVFVTRPDRIDPEFLDRELEVLRRAAEANDREAIVAALKRLVPDFHPASDHPDEQATTPAAGRSPAMNPPKEEKT